MKKIRSYLLLSLLVSSLGVQTTTALANTLTETESPSLEQVETEESTLPSEEPQVPPEEPETPNDSGTEDSTTETPVEPTESKPEEKVPEVVEVVEESSVKTNPYQVTERAEMPSNTPFVVETNQRTQAFIQKIGEDARKIGKDNDLYASVMIAQAILESASGQSELASEPNFNLFGIKGEFEGQFVSFLTSEDNGSGELYSAQANFRKYPSYKESLEDYADLMTKGLEWDANFYHGVSKKEASSYQEATEFLTGKYATDINYHNKLNGLIESYHLTLFDREIDNTEGFIKPFESEQPVTSNFGIRGEENHRGVDFSADIGTPILAIQEGIVVESTSHYSWGEYVKVQHNNGFTSLYAHQSKRAVEVGQSVKKGQVIGYVGSTGNSTGPHLHLELAINNELVNVLDYIK